MGAIWFVVGAGLLSYIVKYFLSKDDKTLSTLINIYIGWVVINVLMLSWQLGSKPGNSSDKEQVYPFDTSNIAAYDLTELFWYIVIPVAIVMPWYKIGYSKK